MGHELGRETASEDGGRGKMRKTRKTSPELPPGSAAALEMATARKRLMYKHIRVTRREL